MSTCKDCLHIDVCKDYALYDKDSIISCDNFKNKADYMLIRNPKYKTMKIPPIKIPKPDFVDSVEVVRCKDCAYFYAEKQDEDFPFCCLHHSGPMGTAPNHFCNYGKRKEEK